jgi:hypothetical protein
MVKPCAEPSYSDRGVMLKQPIKRIFLFLSFFALSFLSTTCGLEEAYFLPQVPEVSIVTELNTLATINLPPLTGYYYAQSYKIFYRIYMSDFQTSSSESSLYNSINQTLYSDFYNILPNTDPTSITAGTAANILFTSRNYYELYIENNNRGETLDNLLTKDGGNVRIIFPTAQGDYPILSFNNGSEYKLLRSEDFFTPNTNLDVLRYFRNSSDINDTKYAANTDVVQRTGLSPHAYVSMYVVASGTNPTGFTPIYSKPTHICVFKLPNN